MEIFVYFITSIIVPIIVPIIFILITPPYSQHTDVRILFETSTGGFLSIWLGTIVFRIFDLQPTSLMVQLIGLFYFFNFFIGFFIKNESSDISKTKLLGGIGCLSGVIIGGIYLL